MIYVSDIEYIREELLGIFPDAIRGSVSKSRWGKGRKLLHLSYYFGGDTAGGYMILGKSGLFYFIEWDTNEGWEYLFAESDIHWMINRVRGMFEGKVLRINKPVGFYVGGIL